MKKKSIICILKKSGKKQMNWLLSWVNKKMNFMNFVKNFKAKALILY